MPVGQVTCKRKLASVQAKRERKAFLLRKQNRIIRYYQFALGGQADSPPESMNNVDCFIHNGDSVEPFLSMIGNLVKRFGA
jgi:hypothetical protein